MKIKILQLLKRSFIWQIFIIVCCGLYALAGSLINVNRFLQYDLGYYDFGIFDVAIWKLSRFQAPIIDHFIVPGKIIFADHFNPSIFLLTPIYWFTSRSEALLIAESLLVGLSGYVLFLIGNKILKNYFLSTSVVLAYFLFIGLQNAIYSDFHELTVMTVFLMLTYWAMFNSRKKLFLLFFIITLGFKESLFLLGIGVSIFVFLYKKEWRKLSIATFLASLLWGFIAIKIIIAGLSPTYQYAPKNIGGITDILVQMVSPLIKLQTLFWTGLSFLFLPLFSPALWPLFLLHYSHRFLTEGAIRWDLGLHYNAEIAPTLAIASVCALAWIQKGKLHKLSYVIAFLLIINSLFLHRFIFHGPLGLAYHPAFYKHTNDFAFLNKMIQAVPKDAKIAAQNNLTVPFLHNNVYILRDDYKKHTPDYILIDARDGQSPGNYLGISDIKNLLQRLLSDKKYSIYYHEGDQYVFKKVN